MFGKQSKISKELIYKSLSRQNLILSHSKYALCGLICKTKSISLSELSKSHYHTNHNIINIKHRIYNKCNCFLCHKSNFHSSPHLREQEQEQQEQQEQDLTTTEEDEVDERAERTIAQNESTMNSKIDFIVDEISKLNLLEVSQLVNSLKNKLNLPDTAMMGSAMPMMAAPAAGSSAGGQAEEEEPEIKQTIFDIVLKSFPTDKKVSVIKEVRGIYKLGLKEAKALVEKAPCTLQAQVPQVEADEIKEKLEQLGAEIVLE